MLPIINATLTYYKSIELPNVTKLPFFDKLPPKDAEEIITMLDSRPLQLVRPLLFTLSLFDQATINHSLEQGQVYEITNIKPQLYKNAATGVLQHFNYQIGISLVTTTNTSVQHQHHIHMQHHQRIASRWHRETHNSYILHKNKTTNVPHLPTSNSCMILMK